MHRNARNLAPLRRAALVLALSLTAPLAHAVSRVCVNANPGLWEDPNNWSPVGAPAIGDDLAMIHSGGGWNMRLLPSTLNFASTLSITSLNIYGDPAGPNTVTMATGSTSVPLVIATGLIVSDRGNLDVQSGAITAASIDIGFNGLGSTATQSGGVVNCTGDLHLGRYDNSAGTYTLSAGTLNVGSSSYVGMAFSTDVHASGVFNQTGGSFISANQLNVGNQLVGGGTYNISAGYLSATNGIAVGDVGSFNQSGGTVSLENGGGYADLGVTGTYHLSSTNSASPAVLKVNHTEYIGTPYTNGPSTLGQFVQDGGTHTIVGNLTMARTNTSHASYTLNGGTVSARDCYVAGDTATAGGIATLTINGGVANIGTAAGQSGVTHIWQGGTFNLNGGALNTTTFINDGVINQTGGTYTIASGAVITGSGTINIGTGGAPRGGSGDSATIFNVGSSTGLNGNALNIRAGTTTASGELNVGLTAGASATVSVSGGSVVLNGLTYVGSLAVGYAGTGTLNVSNAADISTAGNVEVGWTSGGVGTVNHTGGSLTVGKASAPAELYVGRGLGTTATYNINQNTGTTQLTVNGNLYAALDGQGDIVQNGGTVRVNNGYLQIAAGDLASRGSYTISNGSLTTGNDIDVGGYAGGPRGIGSFTANSGSTVTIGAGFRVWQTGTATLNGGTTTAVLGTAVYNGASLNINGGTLNTDPGLPGYGVAILANASMNISAGTVNVGYFSVDGTVNNNGGTVNISKNLYSFGGTGSYNQTSGLTTFANATDFQAGILHVSGGAITAGGTLIIGNPDPNAQSSPGLIARGHAGGDSGGLATFSITGGTVTLGTLGVGNNGTLTGGASTAKGVVNVSAGSLYADTIILGNTTGGSGDMTVSGNASVTVGGGLWANDLTVTGGSVTVQDRSAVGNYPAGEDAVLHDAMVGGYLRDGAFNISGGIVTSPKIKLGITAGKTGTYAQTAGTTTVQTFGIGNDASLSTGAGIGRATLSGGTLNATSLLIGSSAGGDGALAWSGGALNPAAVGIGGVGKLVVANTTAQRTLVTQSLTITGNSAKLDLTDNAMVIDYAPADVDPTAYIRSLLIAGRNGGTWNGTHGIVTSTTTGSPATLGGLNGSVPIDDEGLGYSRASKLFGPGTHIFAGVAVDSTSVIILFTVNGDANLNGSVDFPDLLTVAQNFGQLPGTKDWTDGDFNYDGNVDFADLLTLAQDFNGTVSASQLNTLSGSAGSDFAADWALAQSLVPEPGTLGLIAGAAIAGLRRRRA